VDPLLVVSYRLSTPSVLLPRRSIAFLRRATGLSKWWLSMMAQLTKRRKLRLLMESASLLSASKLGAPKREISGCVWPRGTAAFLDADDLWHRKN
jgi:hypothetical protein